MATQHVLRSESAPRERTIPLTTVAYLALATGIGAGAHYLPELAGPVSLGLATFLTLDRVTRQIR
ncbi:hypothetical protein [Micromonospora sp. NPDC050495]|uniref:hypothetical protein n=1 Tax=Micromonospora sp. NPDC050495 TaxID=3154936 RepID=UPI0033D97D2A